MINYFHKYIPHLAEKAPPLNALRKKGAKFEWTPQPVSYTHLDVYKRQHLTRRMKNLLNWPNLTVIPPEVQSFADEALQKLPAIIRELRRKSDSFRMDEIEKSLKKLYISPVQSPTLEQPPPNMDQESPTVSKIQPTRERNPTRDLNTQTISEAPPPSLSLIHI